MGFQSKEQFIGDMPEQYGATIKGIRKAIARREKRLAECDVVEAAEINEQLTILRGMLDDMIRAKRTVEGYYTGGNCDDAYTCVRQLRATKHVSGDYTSWQEEEEGGGDNGEQVQARKEALRDVVMNDLTDNQRVALMMCSLGALVEEDGILVVPGTEDVAGIMCETCSRAAEKRAQEEELAQAVASGDEEAIHKALARAERDPEHAISPNCIAIPEPCADLSDERWTVYPRQCPVCGDVLELHCKLLTQEQAAEKLGIGQRSVAHRLAGAEKKLRKYLLR